MTMVDRETSAVVALMRVLLVLLMTGLVVAGVWLGVHRLRVCERLAYTAGVNVGWHLYAGALLDYAEYTGEDPFIRIEEDGSWWWAPSVEAIDGMRSDLKRFENDILAYANGCGERIEVLSPWAVGH